MTEKANPSINRPAEAFKTAGAIAYGGHGGGGFVVDGANPTDISVQDGGITEADLNAFAETSDGASLDVTIDGGEAFVFGSWLAIDSSTTVSLTASTAGQTVYVGWNKSGSDDVIVGLDGAFSSATGDTDERIPLWTFDTDGSGVTSTTDERTIGYLNTGNVDLQGGAIFDSTQDFVDLTGDNDDVRVGTGQELEDGSGTRRIGFGSTETRLFAQSTAPYRIYDDEGDFDAVTYTTDATTGTLSLNNAELDLNGNQITDSKQGYLDLTGDGEDLRLATGQAIEDGDGNNRFLLDSGATYIGHQNSNYAIKLDETSEMRYRAYANAPIKIEDREGSFTAVQYDTDATAGVLRTPNAGMRIEGGPDSMTSTSGQGLEIYNNSSTNENVLLSFDRDSNSRLDLELDGSNINLEAQGGLVDMSLSNANLRLATGQGIEDGDGNRRLNIGSDRTQIADSTGQTFFDRIDGSRTRIVTTSTESLEIYDSEQVDIAVQYTTSASAPGTLSLDAAKLQLYKTSSDPSASPGEMWYRSDLD